tara:strand:+ start:6000 stop:6206 length:207 start_codon:yes stop_codon:yes gene_type:complete
MDLLEQTLSNSYDYAIHRMDVLCKLGTIEDIEDAESIRQEFKEWIHVTDNDHDILSLEYFGEGSDFDK